MDYLRGEYYLLLLSPQIPELTSIKQQFGFPSDEDEVKCYDDFLDRIEAGTIWQFRLAANPTHAIKEQGRERGKVVAHVSEQYQMEWLNRKALQNGFTVLTQGACVVGSEWKLFQKKNNHKSVRIKEVVYQGILRVDDADAFRYALVNGIGRGKAYGMGLLTIVRYRGMDSGNQSGDQKS